MTYCAAVRAGLPNIGEFSLGLGLNEEERMLLSRCVATYGNPRRDDEPFANFEELVQARGQATLQEARLMLTEKVVTIFEAKVSKKTATHQERARVITRSAEMFGYAILSLLISVRGFKNSVPTPISYDAWYEENMGQTSYEMMQAKMVDTMHVELQAHVM